MDVDRRKNRFILRVLLVGLVLMGIVVTLLCVYKTQRLRAMVEEETRQRLEQTSWDAHALVESKVDDTFLALETTANTVAALADEKLTMRYLLTVAETYGYTRMGIIGSDGVLRSTDGVSVDLSEQPFIKAALAGERAVSGLFSCPQDGELGIAFAVPLYKEGVQAGALAANCPREVARAYLGVAGPQEQGFTSIIDSSGSVILTARTKYSPSETENFYTMAAAGTIEHGGSLEQMKADTAAGETGLLYYTLGDGIHKAMMYMPMGISDWYLLSVVNVEAVSGDLQRFISTTILVDMLVVALFVALVIALTVLYRKNLKDMERIAFLDSVTDGLNRAGFMERAGGLVENAPPGTYAMVSMDIDRFKLINETFGTENGDKTLRYVYQAISSQLEKDEAVGRISADVFTVLLKNAPREKLLRRLTAIAQKANGFNEGKKQKYFLPFYQGVYVVEEPGLGCVTLQDRANAARKSNHKIRQGSLNVCAFYEDMFARNMRREKEIDDRVDSALENGEFVVYLQPKVELRRNTAAGAEALVRWQDPERGLIPPGEFIRLFEENGFIVKLDLYVFEQVCILLRRWLDEGRTAIRISVNLSRMHMENIGFLKRYEAVRAKYGVPPELIEFELTESVVMDNMQALRGVVDEMHELGFRCSLDDFGSGYSSLNVLKEMPVDTIKLDRAFFTNMERNEKGEHVVQSILDLARRLSIETVCEGVEEPEQLDFLRRSSCDMVQGFIFSRPVPVPEFEEIAFSGSIRSGDQDRH